MSADVLIELATAAAKEHASDIHLESTGDFYYRTNGTLERFDSGMDEGMVRMAIAAVWPDAMERINERGSVDCSAMLGAVRVRANISKTITGISIVMRLIADTAPTPEQLDMPAPVVRLVDHPNGLILATGEFGSGKTTMLASLVDSWNSRHAGHILCLEEPTEFLHRPKMARVSQREIGTHAATWADGIHAARRSDPDILMVGELREPEAVEAAMAAASSGILVLATLHAGSTVQALTALLAMVNDDRRDLVKTQLGQSLRGIVTQQLLPATSGGRVAAREVLIGTETVRNQVLGGHFTQIASTIESSRDQGMWAMKTDLMNLVLQNRITEETALAHTVEPEKLAGEIARARQRAA